MCPYLQPKGYVAATFRIVETREISHDWLMAFRIHDSVVRGEIDNRVKGIARPDLAGCFLTFVNPQKRIADSQLDSLHAVQRGTIGDLTASRKVRVYDVPVEEAYMMSKRGEKPPEHMANC